MYSRIIAIGLFKPSDLNPPVTAGQFDRNHNTLKHHFFTLGPASNHKGRRGGFIAVNHLDRGVDKISELFVDRHITYILIGLIKNDLKQSIDSVLPKQGLDHDYRIPPPALKPR